MGYFVLEIESLENRKQFNFDIISINAKKCTAQVRATQPIADLIDIAQDRPAFRDLVATVT